MELKAENLVRSKKLDAIKWLILACLVAAGVIANSYFSEVAVALRLVVWIFIIAIAVFLVYSTTQGKKFWNFFKDARVELRKVVWPTRQETVHVTMIVMGLVVAMAIIMWGVDSILMWALGFLTGAR